MSAKKKHTKRTVETKKTKKKYTTKQKMLIAIALILFVVGILLIINGAVIPAIKKNMEKDSTALVEQNGTTRLFYDGLTDSELAGYESLSREIVYYKNGIGGLLTAENAFAEDGNRGVFWVNYIDALKNGDSTAYSQLFSKDFDFSNPIERFASGNLEFPPQRLYDIEITLASEKHDDATATVTSVFYVKYYIYMNEGDFRVDMTDDSAPLEVTVEETDGKVLITKVDYRYK